MSGVLKPPTSGVTIRMYNTYFGDAYLLAFRGEDKKPFYMLLDCGIHHLDQRGKERMQLIARDIATATGSKLNILAITHEHTDHLYGFMYAEDIFKDFQIDELWLAWTEDENNEIAKQLKSLYGAKIKALQAAINQLRASNSPFSESLENLLDFDSPLGISDLMGTGDILKFLRSRATKKLEKPEDFRTPSEAPIQLPNVKGVKVYVFGPPTDAKMIRDLLDSKEMYPGFGVSNIGASFEAAVLANVTLTDSAEPASSPTPFDKRYSISKQEAQINPDYKNFFNKTYGFDENPKSGPQWRRIDTDWLGATTELALWINNYTNNTSLVLAIELTRVKPHKVLLFPGDAQVGNILSWQPLSWQDKNTGDKITAPEILNRTVFYKVGHHGSRNATLQRTELEMMQSDELVAFISVDEEYARKLHWSHPEPIIVEKLLQKTRGRVIRSDKIPSDDKLNKPTTSSDGEWHAFVNALSWDRSPDKLWIQYTVK